MQLRNHSTIIQLQKQKDRYQTMSELVLKHITNVLFYKKKTWRKDHTRTNKQQQIAWLSNFKNAIYIFISQRETNCAIT